MREFTRLVDIVATLRSPDGCPWDREQTVDSLKPFVLEETYEVLEAIDRHDHVSLCEELGDFLFEAVFVAQLESEAGHFTVAEALTSIADKLVRRHPHVFAREAGEPPLESGEVVTRWEQIKAQERGDWAKPKTLLGGVPAALPALLRAYQIGLRAKSVGFELRQVVDSGVVGDQARAEEEMGDLLFSIANLSRQLGIEPETALRKANDKFTRRFETMERSVAQAGQTMSGMSLEELEREWKRAKSEQQAG
jgi:MazG family protein